MLINLINSVEVWIYNSSTQDIRDFKYMFVLCVLVFPLTVCTALSCEEGRIGDYTGIARFLATCFATLIALLIYFIIPMSILIIIT